MTAYSRILAHASGVDAAILIFKHSPTDDRVIFIDASREFRQGTTQNVLRETDLRQIVATNRARATVDKYAYVATRAAGQPGCLCAALISAVLRPNYITSYNLDVSIWALAWRNGNE